MNNEIYYGAPNDFRNYVMHFGILGMKWGVRRYQNPDGSLTPAGRKRYGTAENMDNERKYVKRKVRNMAIGSATGALTGLGLTFLNPVAATPLGGMATGAAAGTYLTSKLEATDNPYRNKRLSKEEIQKINDDYDKKQGPKTKEQPKTKFDNMIKNNSISTKNISSALNKAIKKYNQGSSVLKDLHVTTKNAHVRKVNDKTYEITAKTNYGYMTFEYDPSTGKVFYPSIDD